MNSSGSGIDQTLPTAGHADVEVMPTPNSRSPLIALSAFALLLGMCLWSPSAIEQLLLGWIYFPLRVAPQITVDRPTVFVGSVCSGVFLVVLHRTLRWFAGQSAAQTGTPTRRIGIRTTGAVAITVLLMFASGTALVGATHQLVWLVTERKAHKAGDRSAMPRVHGLVSEARNAARWSQQRNNLKQIGLAVHNVHEAYSTLPPGGTMDDHGRLMHGWAIYLGNYASYSSMGIDFSVPWNEPPNDRLYRCALPEFLNPSIPEIFDKGGYGLSHIAGNVHVLPILRVPAAESRTAGLDAALSALKRDEADRRNRPLRLADVRDGLANTILIGEAAGHFRPWGHPANVRDPDLGVGESLDGFGGPPGAEGAQFLMLDGSVRFISDRVDRKIIHALGTPAGGEAIDGEFGSERK